MPDDAPIWRVSVGYPRPIHRAPCSHGVPLAESELDRKTLPPEFENWPEDRRERLLRAYAENIPHWRWHPALSCEHCGRPVIFNGARRIPLHAVCGDACRYAVMLAQARVRAAPAAHVRRSSA